MYSEKLRLLRKAIERRRLKKVRRILLKYPDIQKYPLAKQLNSPLWTAMFLGYEEIVELLIEFGANVDEWYNFDNEDFSEEYYLTFLHWLSLSDNCLNRIKVAKVLIKHGANVNANYYFNQTPLELAIKQGHTEYAELLIKNNGRIGLDQDKYIPLVCDVFCAPISKQREMLHLLIDYNKLDLRYCNHQKENLLHILLNNVAKVGSNLIKMCQILIRSGVPMNVKNISGRSPFYLAVSTGDIELISIFINQGADINDKDSTNQRSVLHIACNLHNKEVIELLLQKGAQISVTDYYGSTPFSLLDSAKPYYNECSLIMIKEFSKLAIENSSFINTDLDTILLRTQTKKHFENCKTELFQMAKVKFYKSLNYYSVLKMCKKIKEFSNLFKNKKFTAAFIKKLSDLSLYYYKSDIKLIADEAIKISI